MNETEIRDRIRDAMGHSPYPPALTGRVVSRLGDPVQRKTAPRLVSFVAALLAIAIVATLVFIRIQSNPRLVTPAASPATEFHPSPTPGVPQADLDGAQLSTAGRFVTQLNLSSTIDGRTVTVIGAYADNSRIVLFFRSAPLGGLPHVAFYDDSGFLNAGGSAGGGSFGDTYYSLMTGPRAVSGGVAHLRVNVDFLSTTPGNQAATGSWSFSFPVNVAGTTRLTLTPPLTKVGRWTFTVEAMEATPTLIHFQAVIAGTAAGAIGQNTVRLIDSSGQDAQSTSGSVEAVSSRSARVNMNWVRPDSATDYVLTIVGGGSQYQGELAVPAPPLANPGQKGGVPPKPTDYPPAFESLRIEGALSSTITSANPNECGAGGGPSGMVFAFGAWFRYNGAWYMLLAGTDPRYQQYNGPGTYSIRATITPDAPLGADPIFEGPLQLTVTSDRRPGPQMGSLRGTLAWTGTTSQPYTITISGNWTCTWSDQLGPG